MSETNLPPCGLYRTTKPVGDVPAGALVYFHNHGTPGAAVPFQIRVDNPPADAVDLEATFASPGEALAAGGPAHVTPGVRDDREPLVLTTPAAEHVDPATATPSAQALPIEGLAPRFTNG